MCLCVYSRIYIKVFWSCFLTGSLGDICLRVTFDWASRKCGMGSTLTQNQAQNDHRGGPQISLWKRLVTCHQWQRKRVAWSACLQPCWEWLLLFVSVWPRCGWRGGQCPVTCNVSTNGRPSSIVSIVLGQCFHCVHLLHSNTRQLTPGTGHAPCPVFCLMLLLCNSQETNKFENFLINFGWVEWWWPLVGVCADPTKQNIQLRQQFSIFQ